jgi:hypothetical protein
MLTTIVQSAATFDPQSNRDSAVAAKHSFEKSAQQSPSWKQSMTHAHSPVL